LKPPTARPAQGQGLPSSKAAMMIPFGTMLLLAALFSLMVWALTRA
jgi:hypothetical protein